MVLSRRACVRVCVFHALRQAHSPRRLLLHGGYDVWVSGLCFLAFVLASADWPEAKRGRATARRGASRTLPSRLAVVFYSARGLGVTPHTQVGTRLSLRPVVRARRAVRRDHGGWRVGCLTLGVARHRYKCARSIQEACHVQVETQKQEKYSYAIMAKCFPTSQARYRRRGHPARSTPHPSSHARAVRSLSTDSRLSYVPWGVVDRPLSSRSAI